jgi:hypothetical protein
MIGLRELISVFREAARLAAEKEQARKLTQAKYDAALAFNTIWTYDAPSPLESRWMCPLCNSVHKFTGEITVFTGLQFPACCNFPEGHRQFKCHATTLGQR